MAKKNTVEIAIQAKDEASRIIEKTVRSVSSEFSSLNASLKRIGADSGEISKINAELRKTNPKLLEAEIDKVRDSLKRMGADSKQIERITNSMKDAEVATEKAEKSFKSSFLVLKSGAVVAGAAVLGLGTVVGKFGIEGAANMEAYRNTLNVVMKDTEKAAQTLAWAVDFANKTPFETDGIVEATVRLQAYGLKAKEVLPAIGDMASVMNKDIMQAVEAVADAQTGELERLKEFGITKQMIVEEGNQIMKNKQLVNNKGQIVDQENFNKALFSLMEKRFKGGMEIQANSFKGLWSTVTGIFKSSFTTIMGVSKTGEVVVGGVFDTIKQKVKLAADKLTQWSQDGTLERIGNTISSSFTKAIKFIEDMINAVVNLTKFTKEHWSVIEPILAGIAAGATAFFVITSAIKAYRAALAIATTVQMLFNGVLTANPIGITVVAIGALVAAGVYLYKNWDTVRINMAKIFNSISYGTQQAMSWMTIKVLEGLSKVLSAVDKFSGWIPKVGKQVESAKAKLSNMIDEAKVKQQNRTLQHEIDQSSYSLQLQEVKLEKLNGTQKETKAATTALASAQAQHTETTDKNSAAIQTNNEKLEEQKKRAKEAVEAITEGLSKVKDAKNVLIDIAKTGFEIFKTKLGESADKANMLNGELRSLNKQLNTQNVVVAVTKKAYEDMKKLKGENAVETRKLYLEYLKEVSAQESLKSQINQTNKALKEQKNAFSNMAKDIQKVAQTYRNDMAAAATEYWDKIREVNARLADDEKKLTKEYDDQLAQRASALRNFAGLFDEIANKEVSGAGLLKNLRDQVNAFKKWGSDIKALVSRGVDQGLIAELREMGPKSGSEIAALNSLTSEQLNEYVALWQEKAQAANAEALGELDYLKEETTKKINDLRVAAVAEIDKYKTEWVAKNAELTQNALDAVKEIEKAYTDLTGKSTKFGTDFIQGIIDGMKSKFQDLSTAVGNVTSLIGGPSDILPTGQTVGSQTSADTLNAAISQAKDMYKSAKNDEERAAAHALAEWARSQGGTLGGGESSRFNVPGLANGGSVTRSGLTWVGEEGPELLNLPRGSQVTPLDKSDSGSVVRLSEAIEELSAKISVSSNTNGITVNVYDNVFKDGREAGDRINDALRRLGV